MEFFQSIFENHLSELISLFSLIVSFFVLKEAVKMRKLNTEPEVIYYIEKIDGFHFAILENLGNGVAYNINCKITFDSEVQNPFIDTTIEKARIVERNFEYLAPKQRLIFEMGNVSMGESLLGFDTHTIKIDYEKDRNGATSSTSFGINKSTIIHLDNKGSLKTISEKLEKIEKRLEPYKNLISVKSDS